MCGTPLVCGTPVQEGAAVLADGSIILTNIMTQTANNNNNNKAKCKVHTCTGTEALYRQYFF